jgi:hypothetical protein
MGNHQISLAGLWHAPPFRQLTGAVLAKIRRYIAQDQARSPKRRGQYLH